MRETSARLLELLGLMQARSDWAGAELAARLGVSDRTVRNDIARLRELGYPVDAVRGPGGRYRLGVGAKMPPLLLDDEETVAVAVGLQAATGVAGFEESGARALAKLQHVLPDRLRRRVDALRSATTTGPNTDGRFPTGPSSRSSWPSWPTRSVTTRDCVPTTGTSRSSWSPTCSSPGSGGGTSSRTIRPQRHGRRTGWTGWCCVPRAGGGSCHGSHPRT